MATQPRRPIAATPMSFVRAMMTGAKRRGFDPMPAVLAAGLSEQDVNSDQRITAAQMELLADRLMRETNDEALGWFERPLPWGSYGMLLRASLSAPTLGLALSRWCRHHNLLTDALRLQVNRAGSTKNGLTAIELHLSYDANWLTGELQEFCQVSVIRNLLGVCSWLINSKVSIEELFFSINEPREIAIYEILFNTTPTFSNAKTCLLISSEYLELPVCRDEAAARQLLHRALPLTIHTYKKDKLLLNKVKATIRENIHRIDLHAEWVANRLNMSTRTLHRQLKEEGNSFQGIKNEEQVLLARTLLSKTSLSVKQIAHRVGYKNEKSFTRAFYGATNGLTPTAVKKGLSDQ